MIEKKVYEKYISRILRKLCFLEKKCLRKNQSMAIFLFIFIVFHQNYYCKINLYSYSTWILVLIKRTKNTEGTWKNLGSTDLNSLYTWSFIRTKYLKESWVYCGRKLNSKVPSMNESWLYLELYLYQLLASHTPPDTNHKAPANLKYLASPFKLKINYFLKRDRSIFFHPRQIGLLSISTVIKTMFLF